jgi:hypothetical protein
MFGKLIMFKTIFTIICFLLLSESAFAYSVFLEETIEIYNVKVSCQVCHFGQQLNSFGKDFKKQLEISKEVRKAIKALESQDSDNDGFSNVDEIRATSFPGDKLSIPDTVKNLYLQKSH